MTTDQKEKRNDEYNKYVKRVTPTHCLSANMLKAFILGGIICTIGQLIVNTCTQYFGLSSDEASAWCSMILILISCVLTALNLYAPLANWGGAGALVPITGFANGVCSSACEFQVEGQVFGIGCQIFRIAGPVILYGIFSSWGLGVIYLIITCYLYSAAIQAILSLYITTLSSSDGFICFLALFAASIAADTPLQAPVTLYIPVLMLILIPSSSPIYVLVKESLILCTLYSISLTLIS